MLTILEIAGSLDYISELISRYGIIGAAAGSLLFLRVNISSVINYPDEKEKTYQKYAIRLIVENKSMKILTQDLKR